MRLLVLGSSGMLGSAIVRWFSQHSTFEIYGSVRSRNSAMALQKMVPAATFISDIDIGNIDNLKHLLAKTEPSIVINCIGVVKQLSDSNDPLITIPINALFPHQLAYLCQSLGARLIHISTDCVFSGDKGGYTESDKPDATDLYGRSKLLGEVDYPHALTLRTSIIGHELRSCHGLVDWFLSQEEKVFGFTKSVFSGFPTVEIARIISEYVIPRVDLHGIYHLSAEPISKFELLKTIADKYKKPIDIIPKDTIEIDRSLNSNRFRSATGFQPKPWPEMIELMRRFR